MTPYYKTLLQYYKAKYYSVLFVVLQYYKVLHQYYTISHQYVLQSTTLCCKVALQYYKALVRTTTYDSNTTKYYSVLQSTAKCYPLLVRYKEKNKQQNQDLAKSYKNHFQYFLNLKLNGQKASSKTKILPKAKKKIYTL